MDTVKYSREELDEAEVKATLRALTEFVNRFGCPEGLFADALMQEHRTIQQNVFRLMMRCVESWAKEEHSDLRNEFTVQKSKEILEKVFQGYVGVPMI